MRKFLIRGYALIPAEFEMEVEARSEVEAIRIAKNKFTSGSDARRAAYIQNSEDICCAERWEPTARTKD